MPTLLKRVTISLPDDVAEAVLALAEVRGVPQSKIIVSVLKEFAPTLLGVARIQKQMESGEKEAAKQTARHLLGDSLADLLREQMELAPAKKTGKK